MGGTAQLTVTGTSSDGTRSPITSGVDFSSSAASVAAVNSSGVVTAIGTGTATVTATTSGQSATVTVTVAAGSPTLVSIEIVPPTVPLAIGGSGQLTVMGTYSDSSTANLTAGSTFVSSTLGVATVGATSGIATGVAPGTATITATHTASGKIANGTVTVSATAPTLTSIAVVPATIPLVVGGTGQLTVTGTYSDNSTANLTAGSTFVSAAIGVASVSTDGLVTAVSSGTAVITATHTASGKVATGTVNVTSATRTLVSITLAPATATLAPAATQQLTVTGNYSDSTTADLTGASTFVSSATGAATVNASGLVTAVANGSSTITATHTASGFTAVSTITVSSTAPTLVSIAITPSPVGVAVGGSQQLTVTGTYSDTTTADVTSACTFSSSTPGVATVSSGGLVAGVSAGASTITATHTASSRTATVTANVATTTGGLVFFGDFDTGVSFAPFGGSTNDVSVDATQPLNGRSSLKVVVPAGGYTGGAFVAAVPRNLSSFNALTFWAKATTANALNVAGVGDNAATTPPPFSAEALNFPLTSTWTKFVVPLPNPSKLVGSNGLFHFAEGGDNYTFWLNDVQYENLPPGEVGAPTAATANLPAVAVNVGSTSQIGWQPNTVSFATPVLPEGGSLKNVSFAWYDLTSSAPAVATVNATGEVSGVAVGTSNITASLGGLAVTGSAAVTVSVPLALPTTLAPTPTRPSANVIAMFNSSGTYTNVPVDTWNTGWSPQTLSNYVISGKTVMKYAPLNYAGVEFFSPGPAIDASTYTTFHVDVWTPNATKFSVQLVNNVGPSQTVGQANFNAGSTPAITTGTWISLDIPLTSFAGLGGTNALGQLLWLNNVGGDESGTFYIDNVYFWKP